MTSLNSLLRADDLGAIEPIPQAARSRRVRLLLAGHTGRVGGKLVQLIAAERARLAAESRLELHVSCMVNRSLAVWHDPDSPWREERIPRKEGDWWAMAEEVFHTD